MDQSQTSVGSQNSCKLIIHDPRILKLLTSHGITFLTDIQCEAIHHKLFFHKNLLVCTPSGSGKTLIALLAIANILLKTQANAIYLVPYKSLAQEKELQFNQFFNSLDITAQAITSDTPESISILEEHKIIITTYEKCDALLRVQHPFLLKTRCIIIDEIHELGFPSRGGRLEFLLVRLFQRLPMIQIIGLSATIGNYQALKDWLSSISRDFDLIFSNDRPIPLNYSITEYHNQLSTIRTICKEHLHNHGQIIIFVNKRSKCVKLGIKLKKTVRNLLSPSDIPLLTDLQKKIANNHSLAPHLEELVSYGIGYHNAALSFKDRKVIEEGFKSNILKVLVATTTLAAGINLPARAVIVSDIYQYQKHWNVSDVDFSKPNARMSLSGSGVVFPINPNMMFQMLGRAGRMGFDSEGHSYILVRNHEEKTFATDFYFNLIQDPMHKDYIALSPKYSPLHSNLSDFDLLKEIILVLIQDTPGITLHQIKEVINQSFFAFLRKDLALEPSHENLLKEMFIQKFNLPDIIHRYSSTNILNSNLLSEFGKNIQIRSFTASHLEATFHQYPNRFHITFDEEHGISCSCRSSIIWKNQEFNSSVASIRHEFCPHIITFLQYVHINGSNTTKILVKKLLNRILKHDYVLAYLETHGFIKKHPQIPGYYITGLGKLTNLLFINPGEMQSLQKIILTIPNIQISTLLQAAITFFCEKSKKDRESIQNISHAWISEHTVEDILDNHPTFGVGDVFQLKSDMERNLNIFESLVVFHAQKSQNMGEYYMEMGHDYHILSLRMKHGVKPDLLQLMETFPKLSRNRARILAQNGYTTVKHVLSSDLSSIAQKTQISLKALETIIDEINSPKEKIKDTGPKQTVLSNYLKPSSN